MAFNWKQLVADQAEKAKQAAEMARAAAEKAKKDLLKAKFEQAAGSLIGAALDAAETVRVRANKELKRLERTAEQVTRKVEEGLAAAERTVSEFIVQDGLERPVSREDAFTVVDRSPRAVEAEAQTSKNQPQRPPVVLAGGEDDLFTKDDLFTLDALLRAATHPGSAPQGQAPKQEAPARGAKAAFGGKGKKPAAPKKADVKKPAAKTKKKVPARKRAPRRGA